MNKSEYDNGKDVKIGNRYINGKGCVFEVLEFVDKGYSGTRYKVRFLNTGYETIAYGKAIKPGLVKDPYNPNIGGVGYIGEVGSYDERIRNKWSSMMSRCYDKNSDSYDYYGKKGVKVCERWHCFANFLEDFTKIDGYDKELFEKGLLVLDKDKKQINVPYDKMIYSLETCTLITMEENSLYRFKNIPTSNYTPKLDFNKKRKVVIVNDPDKIISNNDQDIVDNKYKNIKGYEFIVLQHICNDYNGKKYLVEFLDTGYKCETYSKMIVKGEVRDPFHPSVYGVGYMGNETGSTTPIYFRWKNIISKCYNQKDRSYKNYGAIGIYVDPRWHCYEYFLKDLPYVKGYDEKLMNEKQLMIELIPGYNYYSIYSCQFIYKPEQTVLYPFSIIDDRGNINRYNNIFDCMDKTNIERNEIENCLNGNIDKINGCKVLKKAMERIPKATN